MSWVEFYGCRWICLHWYDQSTATLWWGRWCMPPDLHEINKVSRGETICLSAENRWYLFVAGIKPIVLPSIERIWSGDAHIPPFSERGRIRKRDRWTDEQTDRRTDGRTAASLNAPYRWTDITDNGSGEVKNSIMTYRQRIHVSVLVLCAISISIEYNLRYFRASI